MNLITIILSTILSIVILFIFFWKVVFLRNPSRTIPKGNNLISPADGKVIEIIEYDGKKEAVFFKGNKKYLGIVKTITSDVAKKGYIISIFMNPLDVHYNRSPIDGKVINVKHTDGKLLPVNTIENGFLNEKVETLIDGKIKVKVIQIAGLIARRIEPFMKKGDSVKKGQIIGLINLGSQVTMILPENIDITIKKGQKVKAGESIIAKLK